MMLDNTIEVNTVIAKGYSKNITGNKLNLNDVSINNASDISTVFIGNNHSNELSEATNITNNSLSITNSTVNNSDLKTVSIVKKAYANQVADNTLEIKDSTFEGDNFITPVFYKAESDAVSTDAGNVKINISNNTVKISGNTTFANGNTKIYGAYLDLNNTNLDYNMNNNTVIIDGASDLSNVDVYGSYIKEPSLRTFANSSYDIVSGNTLIIHSYNDSVKINTVNNFSKYEFYIEGVTVYFSCRHS